MVELLLERDDVNPNKPNRAGRTPLRGATRKGHKGIVKLLLGREDLDPDNPNSYREWARGNGENTPGM